MLPKALVRLTKDTLKNWWVFKVNRHFVFDNKEAPTNQNLIV
jgi:hypothetical protein